MMSQVLDGAVFPGIQGGPLEHVIAAKAVAFAEAIDPKFEVYAKQVKANAQALAQAMVNRGFDIVSGGTDNHLMLVDLRNKNVNGMETEKALVKADITCIKNMVPFDDKSAFTTSGIRLGTAAITTRGLKENDMATPYNECPHCGAHLDSGEKCDCRAAEADGNAEKELKERTKDNDN